MVLLITVFTDGDAPQPSNSVHEQNRADNKSHPCHRIGLHFNHQETYAYPLHQYHTKYFCNVPEKSKCCRGFSVFWIWSLRLLVRTCLARIHSCPPFILAPDSTEGCMHLY